MKTLLILASLTGQASYEDAIAFVAMAAAADRHCSIKFSEPVLIYAMGIIIDSKPETVSGRDLAVAAIQIEQGVLVQGKAEFCRVAKARDEVSRGRSQ